MKQYMGRSPKEKPIKN